MYLVQFDNKIPDHLALVYMFLSIFQYALLDLHVQIFKKVKANLISRLSCVFKNMITMIMFSCG